MKTYTIVELMELARKSNNIEVLRWVNNLSDEAIKEMQAKKEALEKELEEDPNEGDRGSAYDQEADYMDYPFEQEYE